MNRIKMQKRKRITIKQKTEAQKTSDYNWIFTEFKCFWTIIGMILSFAHMIGFFLLLGYVISILPSTTFNTHFLPILPGLWFVAPGIIFGIIVCIWPSCGFVCLRCGNITTRIGCEPASNRTADFQLGMHFKCPKCGARI